MAQFDMFQVHGHHTCGERGFQDLAQTLNRFLTSNPPQYNDAIQQLQNCIEARHGHAWLRHGRPNYRHQVVIGMVEHLQRTIHEIANTGQQFSVQFFEGPMRFILQNQLGNIIQVTANGYQILQGGRRRRSTRKQRKSRKVRKSNRKSTRKN